MQIETESEIYSSRILDVPVEAVYEAFADPAQLKSWWGPEGFTNTIHEFDLKPGGKWVLTMHGPEQGNYENASVFEIVEPLRRVAWRRISKPLFAMEIAFKPLDASKTEISFRMTFESPDECRKIKPYATTKNEENFDRLERLIPKVRV